MNFMVIDGERQIKPDLNELKAADSKTIEEVVKGMIDKTSLEKEVKINQLAFDKVDKISQQASNLKTLSEAVDISRRGQQL